MWRSIWWVGKYAPYCVGTVKQVRDNQARYLAAFASYTAAARTELQDPPSLRGRNPHLPRP